MKKSKVNIKESNGGYLIEIDDGTNPVYAFTESELRQIVLIGQIILKENNVRENHEPNQ